MPRFRKERGCLDGKFVLKALLMVVCPLQGTKRGVERVSPSTIPPPARPFVRAAFSCPPSVINTGLDAGLNEDPDP